MNKEEREKFQQLQNEINHERRCADALADALIHGGMTRQFEALLMHETLRNGIQYPGIRVGQPRAKRGPRRGHPNQWFRMPPQGFYYEPKKPTEEETED
jgi:hypothetical protein